MDEWLSFFIDLDILTAIYYYILIIAAIVSIFNRPSNKPIILLQIYLILVFLIELSAQYVRYLGEYNLWIYNIWVLIQFPILTNIVFSLYNKKYKQLEQGCFIFFILFPLFNFLFWQGFHTFNTITMQIGAVYMVILTLFYFRSLLDTPEKSIISNPYFYVAIAVLIFYTGTVFYFTFLNFFSKNDIITYKQATYILNIINCVTYSLFILAILLGRKSKRRNKILKVD